MAVKNRIFYYDFLRAFAIIAVILCHVDGLYKFTHASLIQSIPSLLNNIGLTGVPIFLMLSGALILNKKYTLKDFFKRRFTRILYPFIFWMFITITIGVVFLHWKTGTVSKVFFGTPAPSWYIWVLIGIYLFIPVINSFLKEYQIKGLEFFLGIWLVTIILNTFGLYPFKNLELSYFAGYIGYVVLGYYLDNKEFRISDKKMFILGFAIFVVFLFLQMYLRYNGVHIFSNKYQNIIIVFQSLGLFLAVKYLDKISIRNVYAKIKENYIGRAIVSLSVCSYGMYFVHYIVLRFIKLMPHPSLKLLPLILILVVFLSWLITYIFSKIPYIKKVCGV